MLNLRYEKKLWKKGVVCVVGIDEAGMGPLAGPVVAVAVRLKRTFCINSDLLRKVNDCKIVSSPLRESIYKELCADPRVQYAVSVISPRTIDAINVYQASRRAMRYCVRALCGKNADGRIHLLVDGALPLYGTPYLQTSVVGGDAKIYSIAAASIIAKVTRDRIMRRLHKKYPHYNFAQHKGYGTKAHYAALKKYGHSPIHRKSFL